jgi:hypothetical protein
MRFPQFAGEYQLVIVAEHPLPAGGGRRNEDIRMFSVHVEANETTRVDTGQ